MSYLYLCSFISHHNSPFSVLCMDSKCKCNKVIWYNRIGASKEKEREKERLDMKIAELESLTNIMNDSDLKNMEKVNDPNFLVIKDDVQYVYNDKK